MKKKRRNEMQTGVRLGSNDRIIHERKKKPVSILSECVCAGRGAEEDQVSAE